MAMTAAERNWLILENAKKSASKEGKAPNRRSPKVQPKPRKTTGG